MSRANMNMPLGAPTDKNRREWKLPSKLWEDFPIPNTVCPSFETCNISRRYELEVRVGLVHGAPSDVRPELIVLPLRLDVSVYSGIAPPRQLLQAMANDPRPQQAPPPLLTRPTNGHKPSLQPPTPVETPTTPLSEIGSYPAQVGSFNPSGHPDIADDAPPPSYEDAMADEIAPVDGPRREYHVSSEASAQAPAFNSDSKGSELGRRVSERLFPSNEQPRPFRSVSTPNATQANTIAEGESEGSPKSPSSQDIGRTSLPRQNWNGKKG